MATRTYQGSRLLRFVVPVILAAFMAVALGLSLGASQAWAGAQPSSPRLEDLGGKTYTVSLKTAAQYKDNGLRQYQSVKKPYVAISDANSSNTSVATTWVDSYDIGDGKTIYVLKVQIKKTGKTKITYTFAGKKHTVTYIVKKYTNPLKSLKVGKKNYASLMNPKAIAHGGDTASAASLNDPFTGKITIKLKKGWKIKKCWYYKPYNGGMKYFKNGAAIPKWNTLYIWVKNGSQNETLYFNAYGRLRAGQI